MKTALKSLSFCVCAMLVLLCGFLFCACDDGFDESTIGFTNANDVVLIKGVESRQSVKLEALKGGYTLEYDKNILEIKDGKIIAKAAGTTKLSLVYEIDGTKYIKSKVVSVVEPNFCGNVSINPHFAFSVDGDPKAINFIGLNNRYNFDVQYQTESTAFSVSKDGTITPKSVGSDDLFIRFVESMDENGNLIYKALQTTIQVLPAPTFSVEVLDAQRVKLVAQNETYYLKSNPSGKSYYFKIIPSSNYDVLSCGLNFVSQNNLVNQQNLITLNSTMEEKLQQFVVYDAGQCETNLGVTLNCYNYNKTLSSINLKFDITREVFDIVANAQSAYYEDNLTDKNLYNLNLINTNFRSQARQSNVFDSMFIEFLTNEYTNEELNVVYDNQNCVTPKDGGYVVNANTECVLTFIVSATNGYSEQFVINITKVVPTGVSFVSATDNKITITTDDEFSVVPTINPSWAIAEIEYNYDTDVFEVKEGVIKPLKFGSANLTVCVGDFQKTYTIEVRSQYMYVFASTQTASAPYILRIDYLVGPTNDESNRTIYNQEISLRFFDTNNNPIIAGEEIEYTFSADYCLIGVTSGYECYVQLYNETYDIVSEKFLVSNT